MTINVNKIINFIKYGHPNYTSLPNAYCSLDNSIETLLNLNDEDIKNLAKVLTYCFYNMDIIFKEEALQRDFFTKFVMTLYYEPEKLNTFYGIQFFSNAYYMRQFLIDSKVWLKNFKVIIQDPKLEEKLIKPKIEDLESELSNENIITIADNLTNSINEKIKIADDVINNGNAGEFSPGGESEEAPPETFETKYMNIDKFLVIHPKSHEKTEYDTIEEAVKNVPNDGIIYITKAKTETLNKITDCELSIIFNESDKKFTLWGPNNTDRNLKCIYRFSLDGLISVNICNFHFKKIFKPLVDAPIYVIMAGVNEIINCDKGDWEKLVDNAGL